jgi:hypothetical protein
MIAKTIGQTTQEAIASTRAAMALPDVDTCSLWLGAVAGQLGSGGDGGISDTLKPYPPTTESAIPQQHLFAKWTPKITISRQFRVGIGRNNKYPVGPGVTPRTSNKSLEFTSPFPENHKMKGVGNDRKDTACELQF